VADIQSKAFAFAWEADMTFGPHCSHRARDRLARPAAFGCRGAHRPHHRL